VLTLTSVAAPPGTPTPPTISNKPDNGADINNAGQSSKYSGGTSNHGDSSSSSGKRLESNTYYYSNNESIFLISKYIENTKDKNYLNDEKNVTVKILCRPEYRLENILLKEDVSPSHILIANNSPKYIILNDPINQSINDLDQSNWTTFKRKSPQSMHVKIDTIDPGSWIKYSYTLKLDNPGWNNLDTIIKYYDPKKKSHLPNYEYGFKCIFVEEEIPPLFITVTKNKKIISPGENLVLEYEIKYLGESQNEIPIEVKLDENNMNIFKSNNSNPEDLILDKEIPARFSRSICFSIPNEYATPKLIINQLPYEINSGYGEITVQTWRERNKDNIYWLLQVLSLAIAFALGFREFKNLEKTILKVGKEIKGIRILADNFSNLKYFKKYEEELDKIEEK